MTFLGYIILALFVCAAKSSFFKSSLLDIRFTRCQAEILLRKYNFTIPEENIDSEKCISRAIDQNIEHGGVKLFDIFRENNKYIVPFFFDGSSPFETHSEEDRISIRNEFMHKIKINTSISVLTV